MPLRQDAVIMPLRHDVVCRFGVACDPAICARYRSRLMTSHRHQDWAHPYYLRAAPGLGSSPRRRDVIRRFRSSRSSSGGTRRPSARWWVRPRPAHICTRTGLAPPTSAPGLDSPLPHLHQDWTHPYHICTGTGLTPTTSAPGLGSPLPTSAPGLGVSLHAPNVGVQLRTADRC